MSIARKKLNTINRRKKALENLGKSTRVDTLWNMILAAYVGHEFSKLFTNRKNNLLKKEIKNRLKSIHQDVLTEHYNGRDLVKWECGTNTIGSYIFNNFIKDRISFNYVKFCLDQGYIQKDNNDNIINPLYSPPRFNFNIVNSNRVNINRRNIDRRNPVNPNDPSSSLLFGKANDWKKFKKLSRKEKNYEKWKASTGRTYQKQKLIKGFGLFLKTLGITFGSRLIVDTINEINNCIIFNVKQDIDYRSVINVPRNSGQRRGMGFGRRDKKKINKIVNELDKLKKEERKLKLQFRKNINKGKIKKKIVQVSKKRQYLNLLLALAAGIITPVVFKNYIFSEELSEIIDHLN